MTARPRGQANESEALESNQALLDISEPCRLGHWPPTSSGSRARTCASRLTVARLAARPRRNDARGGRRGSRTPEARRPTRFRDGIPLPRQSFRNGSGRRRTCTPPIKSRQLCRLELRSRGDVAGRNRTCGAPRFRRPLYRTELRPRMMGEAGLEPATSCV